MNKEIVKNILKRRSEVVNIYGKMCEDNTNIFRYPKKLTVLILADFDKKLANEVYGEQVGVWLCQIKGITVDIAAGILAYFDVTGKDRAAQFISYAGIDNPSKPHNKNAEEVIMQAVSAFESCGSSLYGRIMEQKYEDYVEEGFGPSDAKMKAVRYIAKVFIAHVFDAMYAYSNNGRLPERYDSEDAVNIEPEVPFRFKAVL